MPSFSHLFLLSTMLSLSSALSSDYNPIFNEDELKRRSLTRFMPDHPDHQTCWNRSVSQDGFISPIDVHNHFRPFGGPPVEFHKYLAWMKDHGILFSTMFGIGQLLPHASNLPDCCYYMHCPTTQYMATPDPTNDILNAKDYQAKIFKS